MFRGRRIQDTGVSGLLMVSESLHSERDGRSVDLTVFNCAGRLFKSTPAARRCVQCALGGSRFMCVARRAAAK